MCKISYRGKTAYRTRRKPLLIGTCTTYRNGFLHERESDMKLENAETIQRIIGVLIGVSPFVDHKVNAVLTAAVDMLKDVVKSENGDTARRDLVENIKAFYNERPCTTPTRWVLERAAAILEAEAYLNGKP